MKHEYNQKPAVPQYKLKTPKGVEEAVVGTFHNIEQGIVGAYQTIERKFVDTFLEPIAPQEQAAQAQEENR